MTAKKANTANDGKPRKKRRKLTTYQQKLIENASRPARPFEDAIRKKIYFSAEEAHQAFCEYRAIPDHARRRVVQVDDQLHGERFWAICSDYNELSFLIVQQHLRCKFCSALGSIPRREVRPRVEILVEQLELKLREQQSLYDRLLESSDLSTATAQYKQFLATVETEIKIKQCVLDHRRKLLDKLNSTQSPVEAYYEYRMTRDRIRTNVRKLKAEAILAHPSMNPESINVEVEEERENLITEFEDARAESVARTGEPADAIPAEV